MKITCAQSTLAKALDIVQRAAAKTWTITAPTDMVLLSANGDGKLKLEATDMELAIRCHIPVIVQQSGSAALPAELLTDLVKALGNNDVTAELNDENQVLTLSCERDTARICGVPVQQFPTVPAPTPVPTAIIAPDILRKMIDQVASAASTSGDRPVLGSVFLDSSGKELTLVAADGYRLARAMVTTEEELPRLSVIIPFKAIKKLRQLITDEEQPIALYVGENFVIFRVQGGQGKLADITEIDLVTKTIEGKYPDYKQLIPPSWTTQVVVNIDELTDALQPLLALLRSGKVFAVTLSFTGESATLSGYIQYGYNNRDESNAQGTATITAVVQGTTPRVVTLNPYYLRDALQSMKTTGTSRVSLEIFKDNHPVVVRPESNDDRCLYLIMPMSTPDSRDSQGGSDVLPD